MKKILYIFGLIFALILVGCQNRNPLSVSFIDATGAGSTDNTIVATFAEEKEFKEHWCDIVIKGEIDGLLVDIAKENDQFLTIVLPKKDVWYSLTALMASGQGKTGKESYAKYKETSKITYIIRCNVQTKLKFKGVVGTIEQSAQGGELLANRQDVSKEFELEVKKYQQK